MNPSPKRNQALAGGDPPTAAPARKFILRRVTLRARITIIFASLLTILSVISLGSVYVFIVSAPPYGIEPFTSAQDQTNTLVAVPNAEPRPEPMTGEQLQNADASTYAKSPTFATPSTEVMRITTLQDITGLLLQAFLVVLVLFSTVGTWLSWVVAGRVLEPLHVVNAAAKRAASGNFSHRITHTGPDDELHDLAETFDEMLDTIERSFLAHERFTANASHELKTPLATNQALLDVALSDPNPTVDSLRKTAMRVRETNAENVQLVETLLELTRIANLNLNPERVRMSDLLRSGLDVIEPERKAAQLIVHGPNGDTQVSLWGNKMLLQRVINNLLLNAVRHNHERGEIWITLASRPGWVTVMVSNTGQLVRPQHIAQITEPFMQVSGRVREPGKPRGHGLGLSIVESIVSLHGGMLSFSANPGGGLQVKATFPSEPN